MATKITYQLLPRSIMSVLHEPVVDPRDGHGARSAHYIMILRKWSAAKKGDDEALMDLVRHIVREDLAKLKAARKERQWAMIGGGPYRTRTLIPAMLLLGMIEAESVEVPPEWDGLAKVTSRRSIRFTSQFAKYAFQRTGVDARAVENAKTWLANGGIQRPRRGDVDD